MPRTESYADTPIPKCRTCDRPIVELVNHTTPDGPRFVAVEPSSVTVGDPYYMPGRHVLHEAVCPGKRPG